MIENIPILLEVNEVTLTFVAFVEILNRHKLYLMSILILITDSYLKNS